MYTTIGSNLQRCQHDTTFDEQSRLQHEPKFGQYPAPSNFLAITLVHQTLVHGCHVLVQHTLVYASKVEVANMNKSLMNMRVQTI